MIISEDLITSPTQHSMMCMQSRSVSLCYQVIPESNFNLPYNYIKELTYRKIYIYLSLRVFLFLAGGAAVSLA